MNVLVAMDSLKGSLSSNEANQVIKKGLQKAHHHFKIETVPIADGGEGTVEAFVLGLNGAFVTTQVTGPLGEPTFAKYGLIQNGKTAVIEVAEACGLPLIDPSNKRSTEATSYGVGELILHAIEHGCESICIGLGGSATTDVGIGMLQALGCKFLNAKGQEVGFGGKFLSEIQTIDNTNLDPRIQHMPFHILCDVQNPLFGPNGAAYIFSPQKGASPDEMAMLDKGLHHFSTLVDRHLGIDLQNCPGAGAAGGLGAAFLGFLNGKLTSGVEFILQQLEIEMKLNDIQLVITGEGKLDGQSSMGKAPTGIARLAKRKAVPVIALAGDVSFSDATLHELGINAFFSIVQGPISLEEAMKKDTTIENLYRTAEQIGRLLSLSN